MRYLRTLLQDNFPLEFLAALWPKIWSPASTMWSDLPVFELEDECFLRYCEPCERSLRALYLGRSSRLAPRESDSYYRAIRELGEAPLILLRVRWRRYSLIHEATHHSNIDRDFLDRKRDESHAFLSEILAYRWDTPRGTLKDYLCAARELSDGRMQRVLWSAVAGRDGRVVPDFRARCEIVDKVAEAWDPSCTE